VIKNGAPAGEYGGLFLRRPRFLPGFALCLCTEAEPEITIKKLDTTS
jgi:hypothetical protein